MNLQQMFILMSKNFDIINLPSLILPEHGDWVSGTLEYLASKQQHESDVYRINQDLVIGLSIIEHGHIFPPEFIIMAFEFDPQLHQLNIIGRIPNTEARIDLVMDDDGMQIIENNSGILEEGVELIVGDLMTMICNEI